MGSELSLSSPPSNFDPKPRSSSDRPPPSPPSILKHEIYTDPKFFKNVDVHAVKVARKRYRNFRDLIWDLTFSDNFNELQKTRAIFRWMTLKQMHNYAFEQSGQDSPESILQGFQSGASRTAETFKCLALYAGLHCVSISGWTTTEDYKPGMGVVHTSPDRMWNAVHIDGNWQLVDCTDAYYSFHRENTNRYEYDDFYFIPDPSEIIYNHFPEDPAWQLLSTPCSSEQFEGYPLVHSKFFTAGMHFIQQTQGIIYTHNGILTLTLGLKKLTTITFTLECGNRFLKVPLERYIMQETTYHKVTYYFRSPMTESYYLTVFVKEGPENLTSDGISDVCQYKIICNQRTVQKRPFPCLDSHYTMKNLMRYGLTSYEPWAILQTTDGYIDVILKKSCPVQINARLRSDESDICEQQLKDAISIEELRDEVHIVCNLPAPSEYGLCIEAKRLDKGPYHFICQYILAYSSEHLRDLYGTVYDQESSSELVRYNYDQMIYATMRTDLQLGRASETEPLVLINTHQMASQFDPRPRSERLFSVPLETTGTELLPWEEDSLDMTPPSEFNPQSKSETLYPEPLEITGTEPLPLENAQMAPPSDDDYQPESDRLYPVPLEITGTEPLPLENTLQTAPPSDFDPQPRSSSDQPPPAPPRILKHQTYTDPQFFQDIDDHAITVAWAHFHSFRDLIWHLIFRKNFNELEKARVIFRWMTLKKLHDYTFGSNSRHDSPESILQRFQSGTSQTANTFKCMAQYAGLHCTTVVGWTKNADYKHRMQLPCGPNHIWNAVNIDGNWQLIDCSCATRSQQDNPAEYNDFYFIPDPSQMIYIHYPVDPAWQLCNPTKRKGEFAEYPLVHSMFFNIGMHFLQQNKGLAYTHNGILVLTLGLKEPTALSFEIESGDYGSGSYKGIPLDRYMIQETANHRISFYFRAPEEGTYYLKIYAQGVSENFVSETDGNCTCEYKIICNEVGPEAKPFPSSTNSSYGPGAQVVQRGLVASEQKGILPTTNGEINVVFTRTFPIRMLARVRNDDMPEQQLKRAVSVAEHGDQVHVKCNLPVPGEYGLHIYAKEPSFHLICQYLVAYISQDFHSLCGQVHDEECSSGSANPDTQASSSGDLYPGPQGGASGDTLIDDDPFKPLCKKTASLECLPDGACVLSRSLFEDMLDSMRNEQHPLMFFECAVCMDDYKEISQRNGHLMSAKCGHIFCEICTDGILEREKKCPTCRGLLNRGDVHRIFLQSGT